MMHTRGEKYETVQKRFTQATDARDGLFPSLRFALAHMHENGWKYLRSDRIANAVADLLGADPNSVYDTLINATLPRSQFALVYGHGMFGFPPADMHFSEMRVSGFYRDAITLRPAADPDSPLLMAYPNLLISGTMHCEGKRSFVPPHNPAEVIDAAMALVKNPALETADLLQYIKGPDLPLGGEIVNTAQLQRIYEKGRGTVEVKVTQNNIDDKFIEEAPDYAGWYNIRVKTLNSASEHRLYIKYKARLFDGRQEKLMSLKEILQSYIDYCREAEPQLSDAELCERMEARKVLSPNRKTQSV